MNHKTVKTISNILFYMAIIIGGYGIFKTIITYINTPPGVCPISSYRQYLIYALGLSVLSLIATWFNDRRLGNRD